MTHMYKFQGNFKLFKIFISIPRVTQR